MSTGGPGGAGALMSPWVSAAAGGVWCSISHPWEWRGAAPVWAAWLQSQKHGPPVYRAGRSQPAMAQRPVAMSGWGAGSQGGALLLAPSASGWRRRWRSSRAGLEGPAPFAPAWRWARVPSVPFFNIYIFGGLRLQKKRYLKCMVREGWCTKNSDFFGDKTHVVK